MSPRIRAISIDMDGTLYRVPRLTAAWRLRSERGLLLALLAAREKIRHEPPREDLAALREREAELVAPSFHLTLDEARTRLAALRLRIPGALTRGVRPYRGAKAALLAAHAAGVQLAIFSDYLPEEKLVNLGIDQLPWATVLGAEEVGALKPHKRGFLEIASRLSVEPHEVLHIGDREDLDVHGALNAGLRAWRFSRDPSLKSRSEFVFDQWSVVLFQRVLKP